ncbi:GumC family protein [Pseudodesulfovibrio piezophilus]|uniref:Lipopolysaccharide biosynthesis protein n=1 Tax=Pseudodesulfovibrio piezophilus (strain DSM 21447 / JCM 15486 / C1TLV30) TaxID=1322246 RepID=M1WN16_PSEP2|nr:Wzz/FepE/Etk N-terminal domain-containing protein [Pseudodesulfovibrio piezophilus]CCH50110.1 Lipopolysaccharide biosynthesis protein [Pseudodesulfovibrio piezophilus C1TLV30]
METNTNDIRLYINAFKRRFWLFAIPTGAFFMLTAAIIFLLPSIYTSSATILVEGQEVPQELVQTTVTGYVEERLQSISQMAFNRQNLMAIIDRFGLYDEYKDSLTSEEILQKMRDNIKVENIQAEVVNNTGRATTATIAFTISFDGKSPKKVLQTTNALVSLFLEQNLRQREEKALTTLDFLNKQLDELRQDVQKSESKIASFKEKNYRSLPELMELNLQSLDRIQKDIDARQEMIKTLTDRRVYLEGQLATVDQTIYSYSADGKRIMSPEEELKSLRSQYLSYKTSRSEKHPDMIKLKGQIDLLEAELTHRNKGRDINAELGSWERKLARLQKKYTNKHPDVINAKGKIAELKASLQVSSKNQGVLRSNENLDQENPAYINLKTQIKATSLEIRNERNLLTELRKKYDQYVSYIEQSPQVEQQYTSLQRDYHNSSVKYQETMQKVLSARQSQELEKEHVGEKLSLIEPPVLPEKPYKPKRLLLLIIAMIVSTAGGLSLVSVAEFMDHSIHDRTSLALLTKIPVIGVIPYVQTSEEMAQKRRRRAVILTISAGAVICAILLVHFLVLPLDIIALKILNKIQVIV